MNLSLDLNIVYDAESNRLTVQKREDLPNNFYPKNIQSLKAIIGENGTGKSTVIELLRLILQSEDMGINDMDRRAVFVIRDDDNLTVYSHKLNIDLIQRDIDIRVDEKRKISDERFDFIYTLDLPFKGINGIFYSPFLENRVNIEPNERYFEVDYSTNTLLQQNSEGGYNLEQFQLDNIGRQLDFLMNADKSDLPFSPPTRVKVILKERERKGDLELFFDQVSPNPVKIFSMLFSEISAQLENEREKENNHPEANFELYIYYDTELSKMRFLDSILQVYFKYCQVHQVDIKTPLRLADVQMNSEGYTSAILDFFTLQQHQFTKLSYNLIEVVHRLFDPEALQYWSAGEDFFLIPYEQFYEFQKIYLQFTQHFPDFAYCFDFNWSNEEQDEFWPNGSVRVLSSGEKSYLDLLSRLFVASKNLNTGEDYSNVLYLFIDEGEIGFHPEWQRNYISVLLQFIENNLSSYKVNCIISSHSPIIVSDLPSQDILFLRNGVARDEKIETFGANIHELFKEAFFLDGGVIGEFALNKINDAIELITSEEISEENKEYLKKFIPIIGEPLIRDRMESMFNEKFGEQVVTEMDELLARIRELEEENNRLRNEED
ncbi:AAA family ATPase [Ekhidna sp.]|uniref:AAA family ATPase n=1 Tax=Ekhidna sp. TaxID=2608089 RepID=UPI003B5C13D2